jgi:uncharacterized protein (TIGR02246 family)
MTHDEIAAAVNRLGDAFAAGDPDQVLSQFAPDDEVMYAGSEPDEVAAGRPALRALLTEVFGRDERYHWSCTHAYAVETAQGVFVLADATLTVHTAGPDGAPAKTPATESFPYRISGLLEHHQGHWRWRACHGSEPACQDSPLEAS